MQKSIWPCFLVVFATIIGGIHALGFTARPASAQSAAAMPAAAQIIRWDSTHWHDLMIQNR